MTVPGHGGIRLSRASAVASIPWAPLRWSGLALLACVLAGANLGGVRPLTQHEVLVAQTAREMRSRGDFVHPTYLGEPRLRKPPLAYWLVASSFALCGTESEGTARLPLAACGVALVLVLARLGARQGGERAGLATGFVAATSVWWLTQARLAEADIALALAVAVAFSAYDRLLDRESPAARWAWWIALGAGVLAKGPVVLVFVVAPLAAHAAWQRSVTGGRRLAGIWPALSFAVLALGWPTAVALTQPGAVAVWYRETLGRVAEDPGGTTRHAFYYPLAALWLTLPWAPLWVVWLMPRWARTQGGVGHTPILRGAKRAGLADCFSSHDALLLCWFLVPLGLLSLSAGKQEHYLIPALGPCAIWSGRAAARLLASCRRRARVGFAVVGSAVVLGALVLHGAVLPRYHGRWATVHWFHREQATVPPDAPVLALGHPVQWLAFHREGTRPMVRVDSLEAFLAAHANSAEWVLATRTELPTLAAHRTIAEARLAPADPGVGERKRPLLVRLR